MEQVPGQVVADTKAPREWVGFNVSESLVGDKKPLDSRAGGGVRFGGGPHFQCPGSQTQAESHTLALFLGTGSVVLGWLLVAGSQS